MVQDKINRKYHSLIWLGLIFATLINNFYALYYNMKTVSYTANADRAIDVVVWLIENGISAALTYVFALIVFSLGFRRYVRAVSRNDFCYWVMIFTAASRFIVGLASIFAILDPNVEAFTHGVFDFTLHAVAMLVMFFVVFKRVYKFNPVEKYNSFSFWTSLYMVFLALRVVGENALILIIASGGTYASLVQEITTQTLGYAIVVNTPIKVASIMALSIYGALLVTVIVLGELMRKDAAKFRNPETREEFFEKQTVSQTSFDDSFPEFSENGDNSDSDKNVFDEFDI